MLIMKFENIPGMIEPIEQELLYKVSKNLDLTEKKSIVELGSFFGKSTNSIIQGLNENISNNESRPFLVYDNFECLESESFAPSVKAYAKKFNVEHLLNISNSKINFLDVFKFYTNKKYKNLKIHQEELENSLYADKEKISLIFIDSPKFYPEFSSVLKNFFVNLEVGSKVIFQDFFYHWSGSVIAAIEIMFQNNLISFQETAASSLLVSIDKTIDQNVINNIELIFKNSKQSQLIDKIYQRLSSEKIDRHNYFLNRLLLAKIQIMVFEEKDMEEAKKFSNYIFKRLYEVDYKSAKLLSNDFEEFLKFNFNLYDLYKLDHF
jgi:hypothetical protein